MYNTPTRTGKVVKINEERKCAIVKDKDNEVYYLTVSICDLDMGLAVGSNVKFTYVPGEAATDGEIVHFYRPN